VPLGGRHGARHDPDGDPNSEARHDIGAMVDAKMHSADRNARGERPPQRSQRAVLRQDCGHDTGRRGVATGKTRSPGGPHTMTVFDLQSWSVPSSG